MSPPCLYRSFSSSSSLVELPLGEDHVVVSVRVGEAVRLYDVVVEVVAVLTSWRVVGSHRGAAAAAVAAIVVEVPDVVPVEGGRSGRRVGGRTGSSGGRGRGDSPVLSAPLDAFVAVLVQRSKVLEKLLVVGIHHVSRAEVGKLLSEVTKSGRVKLVLVRLWLVSD